MSKRPPRNKKRGRDQEPAEIGPRPEHERATVGDKPVARRSGNGKRPPPNMGDWIVGDPH